MNETNVITIAYDCTSNEGTQASNLLRGLRDTGKKKGRPFGRGIAGWILFISLAIVFCVVIFNREPPRGTASKKSPPATATVPGAAVALAIFAIGVGFVIIACAVVVWNGRRIRGRWRGFLTCSFDNEGLTIRRQNRAERSLWARFGRFEEGAEVFALRGDGINAMSIPKRLFANAGDCDRVRLLFQQNIRQVPTSQQSFGFPVITP
jgi:hypothetical protein